MNQEIAVEEILAVAVSHYGVLKIPFEAFTADTIYGKMIAVDNDGENVVLTLVDSDDVDIEGEVVDNAGE